MPNFISKIVTKYKKELGLWEWDIMVEVYFDIETKTTYKDKTALICINKSEVPTLPKLAEIILREMTTLTKLDK